MWDPLRLREECSNKMMCHFRVLSKDMPPLLLLLSLNLCFPSDSFIIYVIWRVPGSEVLSCFSSFYLERIYEEEYGNILPE